MKKQMPLPQFIGQFGMSRSTALRLINRIDNPLPAYKIGGQWYVDIEQFEKWREQEHKRQYRYA